MDPRLRIAEAKKARSALVKKAEKILAESEEEDLTEESQSEFDQVMEEISKLDARITRLEQLVEKVEEDVEELEEEIGEDTPTPAARIVASTEPKITNREQRIAFKNFIQRGIRSVRAAHTTSTAADIVPVELVKQVIEAATHENWLRPFATVRSIAVNTDVPVVVADTVSAYTPEGAALPEVDPDFSSAKLRPRKLVGLTKYTWELELLNGLEEFEQVLSRSVGKSLGETEIKQMLTGAGTAGPQGVLTASVQGVEATAGVLMADDLIDLVYTLKPQYRARSVFTMNGQTIAAVRKLKDGDGRYLWAPSIAPGQPETLLGRPLYEDPNMPDIGTGTKSVLLFDPSYYVIGDRTEMTMQILSELFAGTGQKGIVTVAFNDGRLALAETAKHIAHKS